MSDASELWADVAAQVLRDYPRGLRLVAVAGADAERSRAAADALAAALDAAGHPTEREHSADGDELSLRERVSAFRAQERTDRVLVVSGPATLLSATARGIWHFTVWQLAADEPPHSAASTLIDVTDPQHPTRRFADYCSLPASYGA